ncbi:MAG TPA: type 2 isopentenyl-diphosphate Delta-isomerase [Chloroflexi bacterium]|nr:type 2 isopentenyl-diphosphate Delta-isomerase [Chloroflexota bacterium]
MLIPQRKSDHLRITLDNDVQSRAENGLDRYQFEHNALPEIGLVQVDLASTFLGVPLAAPLLISSMTGGTEEAAQVNRNLALTAQTCGIAMGIGSQRAMLAHPELASTYQVRRFAPDILLFANIGAVQFNYGLTIDQCRRLVEDIQANALILHFNPLQEALQPEGETNFSTLLPHIEQLAASLQVPVVAKEVGAGISLAAARRLVDAGVAAIDVAGTGGTSWALVEMYRMKHPERQVIAAQFADWGLPTAECIQTIRAAYPDLPLIASGGLRNGIHAAKCIGLGADLVGMSTPFLKPAMQSAENCIKAAQEIIETMRIAAFLIGARSVTQLKSTPALKLRG